MNKTISIVKSDKNKFTWCEYDWYLRHLSSYKLLSESPVADPMRVEPPKLTK